MKKWANFYKSHKRLMSFISAAFSTALVISIGYSNCSQVKFSQQASKSTGAEGITSVCDPNNRPNESETQACPGDNTRQATRVRAVFCDINNTWSTGTWGAWDYSACVCPVSGQTVNAATGLCECPSGTFFDTNTNSCVTGSGGCTGTPDTYQQDNSCPSGSGFRFRSRSVTCTNNAFVYTPANWDDVSWNYSSCQCTNSGEVLNPLTGSCSCPTGQVLVNNACVTQTTCSNDPDVNEQLRTCQVGYTYRVKSVTRTYVSATNSCALNTSYSAERFDQCGCANSQQTLNQTDLSCNCPSGQVLINGICQVPPPPTCDPNTKPGPWFESVACSTLGNQFSGGNATRDRLEPTCVSGAWSPATYNSTTPPWNPWNYGACVCANQGETVNPSTGQCSCPANYALYNGQCRLSVCTTNTNRTETESCSAVGTSLSASGNRTRSVPVACINNGTGTQDGTPTAWDYSACSCSAFPGTTFNTTTRACECGSGNAWNASTSSCQPTCNQTGATTAACGGGATTGSFTRTDACSAWTNNCACPSGQTYVVTNAATPAGQCQCSDANLSLYNGQCLPRVCSFSGTQSETQTTGTNACGFRVRDITCSNNGTTLNYGPWKDRTGTVIPVPNDRYDYSTCACPASGQTHTPDKYSATCSCPSDQQIFNGSCQTPVSCNYVYSGLVCPDVSGSTKTGQGLRACVAQPVNNVCTATSTCSDDYSGCSYTRYGCTAEGFATTQTGTNNPVNWGTTTTSNGNVKGDGSKCACPAPTVDRNGRCELCPNGQGYSLGICAQCGAGYESNSAGYCQACTGNTYSNGTTVLSCTACPSGTTANANHTACENSQPVCANSVTVWGGIAVYKQNISTPLPASGQQWYYYEGWSNGDLYCTAVSADTCQKINTGGSKECSPQYGGPGAKFAKAYFPSDAGQSSMCNSFGGTCKNGTPRNYVRNEGACYDASSEGGPNYVKNVDESWSCADGAIVETCISSTTEGCNITPPIDPGSGG